MILSAPLDRTVAAEYASWFKALADATRVQIVSLLARCGAPMSVGAITAALDVGQSTVSAHLKVLAEVGFVLAERRGTAAFYRVNEGCVECFPTAADIVMGRPVPATPGFTQIAITPAADAGGGLRSAIIRATRPAAPDGVLIRPMRAADAGQVLAIYQAGLDTGQASFETTAPGWDAFDAAKLPLHRHVAVRRRHRARCSAGLPPRRSPTGASTRGWSSTASTSIRRTGAAGSAPRCWPR